MSGIVVIGLVAVVLMLLAGVGVSVMRLASALRGLKAAVDATNRSVQPIVEELSEAGQLTSVETAALQASIASLRDDRGATAPDGSPATGR